MHRTALRSAAAHFAPLQRTSLRCSALRSAAEHRSRQQCTAAHFAPLQSTAAENNVLQRSAPHSNTDQAKGVIKLGTIILPNLYWMNRRNFGR